MNSRWVFVVVVFSTLNAPLEGQNPAAAALSGVYVGSEAGGISYNTQITFDGVDDPAGRGAFGFGAFVGYNHALESWLVTAEATLTGGTEPGPYTFDATRTGFAELDLERGMGVGLSARVGRMVAGRALIQLIVGYSVATQTVSLDGVPLSEIPGGSDGETFGTFQLGGGVDIPLSSTLGFRFVFRSLGGHDLSADDFGSVVSDTSLTFFDVEPGVHQFLFGFRYLI